jgi:DNA invertase Pin-like site-specific DNA recombinase
LNIFLIVVRHTVLKKEKSELIMVLKQLREDEDTLVVWKLNRLGRSVKGMINLVEDFEKRKINFKRFNCCLHMNHAKIRSNNAV